MRTALILILIFGTFAFAQSGRRARPAVPTPTPTPEEKPSLTPSARPREQVTAEKDQDYSCTNDGSLAHLLDPPAVAGFSPKEVDVKAEITSQPEPERSEERRVGKECR